MDTVLSASKKFKPWKDPQSGVTSYILVERVAPLQQSFYFTNPSMTNDGRYLWFYCAFPPAGDANYGRTLGVVDLYRNKIHHYPETQFLDASPMVDVDTGEVYWCNKSDIWKRGPGKEDRLQHIAKFPDSLRKGVIHRIATHLTYSADKKELSFDAEVGNRSFVGSVSLNTGNFLIWQEFGRCYNHAQFNPCDPNLMLLAQDYFFDKVTGRMFGIQHDKEGKLKRMWVLRRGKPAVSVMPKWKSASHEWWSADGKYIYYIDSKMGTVRINTKNGEKVLINPYGRWHGHSSRDNHYFVSDNIADENGFYRGCAANVIFFNRHTQRKVNIVTKAPALSSRRNPSVYHVDPHPQFVCNDRFIIYTTSVLGSIDVAVVKTKDLIAATGRILKTHN